MALCVYHETTEAAQPCRVCKQDVCSKCLEYGEDGMCGMCLEMANARKATAEAARQARTEAATTTASGPQPRPPAPQGRPQPGATSPAPRPAPPKPQAPAPAKAPTTGREATGPSGAPKGAAPATGRGATGPGGAPPAGRAATGPLAPPAKPAAKPGMCAEHPDQKASATCTHCEKKVCPYCLDLYDLCSDCRNLPSCARHESMVAQAKCVSCKMDYCKVCLSGTDQCDRCRAIGAPKDPSMAKAPTQPLKAAAKGTSELKPPPGGVPGDRPTPPKQKVKPADHIYRPNAKGPVKNKQAKALPIPAIAGGAVLVLALGFFILGGGHKPALTQEQEIQAIQDDMTYVQQAAISYEAKNGRYPDNEAAIMEMIQAKGVKPEGLKIPIKLAINTPATEPWQISFRLVGDGFEVRAVDKDGRPFTMHGKDVVYTHQANAEGH